MNMAEILSRLLPYVAYFLAAIPPVLVTKYLFAYLAARHRIRSELERFNRSLEGTDPESRADILRAFGQGRHDERQ